MEKQIKNKTDFHTWRPSLTSTVPKWPQGQVVSCACICEQWKTGHWKFNKREPSTYVISGQAVEFSIILVDKLLIQLINFVNFFFRISN